MKVLYVFWKDLLILLKDRGTYINLFVLPLMFSIVLTLALGGVFGGGKSETSTIQVPIVASTSAAKTVAKAVEHISDIHWITDQMTVTKAKNLVENGKSLGAVIVSNDGKTVTFYEDPDQLTNSKLMFGQIKAFLAADTLTIQHKAIANLAMHAHSPTLASQLSSILTSKPLNAVAKIIGNQKSQTVQPTAAQQYIPGFTVAFLFFIASTIAQYMFMERERGTLRRLLTSPVRKYSILIGKLLPNIVIGFGQVIIIFAVGKFMFGMQLGDLSAILILTCAAVAAANGFGLMITSLSKTQAQATGLATLLVFTLATVAGCYVPLFLMPSFMQDIALATPQGWAMSGFQDIIMKGADIAQVLPNIGMLFGFALVFFFIGLARFRFD
ncbi:ABC transporter permease [Alicyclobacillus tolerans]|uniref:ABC transporter permease n=1 Tax=Alicyclobacillus tolerans TaxID=90970 RepID=UPI003B79F523